jgi:hypothetical protein
MIVQNARRLFTIDEYERMISKGVFEEDEHLELIRGEIVERGTSVPRLFTIDEYEWLIEIGVLAEDEHLELIRGEIVEMAPINLPHAVCVSRLTHFFNKRLNTEAYVWPQNPIRLPNASRPEPDVALLTWRDDLYAGKHPTSEDVLLLIEVADSSLENDRTEKASLYAEASVPQMWIVNLPEQIVEVYSGPTGGAYENMRRAVRGESLPLPNQIEGVIQVDDILG